jgi:hypothetical protein
MHLGGGECSRFTERRRAGAGMEIPPDRYAPIAYERIMILHRNNRALTARRGRVRGTLCF